jgi:hypothetical protein
MEEFTFQFIMLNLERPPRARLYFNLALHNPEVTSNWFLIPFRVPSTAGSQQFSIDRLEEYHLDHKVVIGHFAGLNGFWALRLPPNARIVLERFPVLCIVQPPNPLPEVVVFNVAIAHETLVGDLPAGDWFQWASLCPPQANVLADMLADQKHVKAVRYSTERQKVGLALEGESWQTIQVPLKPSNLKVE